MRSVIVLFISGLTGLVLTRCASLPLTPQVQAQKQKNEKARQAVRQSKDLSAEDKAYIEQAFDETEDLAQKGAEKADYWRELAQSLEKYRWAVYAALAGAAILGFLKWKARPS